MTPKKTLKQMVVALNKDSTRKNKIIHIKAHKNGYTLRYDGGEVEYDSYGKLTT